MGDAAPPYVNIVRCRKNMIFFVVITILLVPILVFGSYHILGKTKSKTKKNIFEPEILLSLSSLVIALWAILIPLVISHFEKEKNELALFCALRSEVQRNIATNDVLKVFIDQVKKNSATTFYGNFFRNLSLKVLETPGILDEDIKNELAALTLIMGSTNNALESAWLSNFSTDKVSTYLIAVEPNVQSLSKEMDWLLKKLDDYHRNCKNNLIIDVTHL